MKKELSLRALLLGSFGAVILSLCALTGATLWSLQSLSTQLQGATTDLMTRLSAVNALESASLARALTLRDLALNEDLKVQAQLVEELRQQEAQLQRLGQAMTQTAPALRERMQQAQLHAQHMLRLIDEARFEELRPFVLQTLRPAQLDLGQALATQRQAVQLEADQTREHALAAIQWARGLRLAVLAGLLLLGGASALLALWVAARVVGRLGAEPQQLMQAAEALASGDFSHPWVARPGSVLGQLERTRLGLGGLLADLAQAVEHMRTAAGEISAGNQSLSTRTEQQSSSLQQTAATMEELTGAIGASADHARSASDMAHSARGLAAEGGELVSQVVERMSEIANSSRRIGEIIGVIDGIAFQTNILALNAAVEAARAGEQGRGFAVVAGEVRSLAQRCTQAAREIKTVIHASSETIEGGSRLADHTGSSMLRIVTEVAKVSERIAQITDASLTQSAGVRQVHASVAQIDAGTQQNAALVEQTAAAADQLHQLAARLTQSVAVFRFAPGAQVG